MDKVCKNRIAKIEGNKVYISKEDGTVLTLDKNQLDCTVRVGQKVEIFQTREQIIVTDAINCDQHDDKENNRQDQNQSYFHQNVFAGLNKTKVKKVPFILLCILSIALFYVSGGLVFMLEKIYAKKYFTVLIGFFFSTLPFTRFIPLVMLFYDIIIAISSYKTDDGYIIL